MGDDDGKLDDDGSLALFWIGVVGLVTWRFWPWGPAVLLLFGIFMWRDGRHWIDNVLLWVLLTGVISGVAWWTWPPLVIIPVVLFVLQGCCWSEVAAKWRSEILLPVTVITLPVVAYQLVVVGWPICLIGLGAVGIWLVFHLVCALKVDRAREALPRSHRFLNELMDSLRYGTGAVAGGVVAAWIGLVVLRFLSDPDPRLVHDIEDAMYTLRTWFEHVVWLPLPVLVVLVLALFVLAGLVPHLRVGKHYRRLAFCAQLVFIGLVTATSFTYLGAQTHDGLGTIDARFRQHRSPGNEIALARLEVAIAKEMEQTLAQPGVLSELRGALHEVRGARDRVHAAEALIQQMARGIADAVKDPPARAEPTPRKDDRRGETEIPGLPVSWARAMTDEARASIGTLAAGAAVGTLGSDAVRVLWALVSEAANVLFERGYRAPANGKRLRLSFPAPTETFAVQFRDVIGRTKVELALEAKAENEREAKVENEHAINAENERRPTMHNGGCGGGGRSGNSDSEHDEFHPSESPGEYRSGGKGRVGRPIRGGGR